MSTENREWQYQSLSWIGDWDGHLVLLDQVRLPTEVAYVHCVDIEQVYASIVELRVRGAPAIGIAAAYGVCLSLRNQPPSMASEQAISRVEAAIDRLATSRPTAVNLFWALDRMRRVLQAFDPNASIEVLARSLLAEAKAIHEEDRAMCHAIGRWGASLIEDGMGILTHCNTGGLATSELGTALSAIVTAHHQGKRIHVFVDETRPLLQGARLTAWELMQSDVPCTLICDSMAAQVMKEGRVQAVIVGADRITARGDTANKIGTYGLAVLAKHHQIPFYVAAPSSTFDLALEHGDAIPIEQRSEAEITSTFGKRTAPFGISVYNPAFDITPSELIRAVITEHGVIEPVTATGIAECIRQDRNARIQSRVSRQLPM